MIKNLTNRAIFLDRDGTLNYDKGYTHIFHEQQIIEGSTAVLKHAKRLGFLVIIITNQSGIGRGIYSEAQFHKYMDDLKKYYELFDVGFDDYFFAPHYELSRVAKYRKGCEFRKPNIGMIQLAQKKYSLDLGKSILIGDKETDIKAGLIGKISSLVLFNQKCSGTIRRDRYTEVNELKAILELPIW
jgi:D-glycero-D-manno-heptose 1,7-bisphosphate phosphatase